MKRISATRRPGTVVPLLLVSVVALLGAVALAVDVGRLGVAKSQCQNAADAAAIAGARSLDGSSGSGLATATTNATAAATGCTVLSQSILNSEVAVRHGSYHYDPNAQTFSPQIPPVAPDNYNLTEVTITHPVAGTFSGIFGAAFNTISATATAAHRPRDVAIVLDYSGSMNNESDLWNNEGYLGGANNSPNNTDSVFPTFGPYDPAFSPNVALQCTSADPRVGKCNITQAVLGIPAMVDDYYKNAFGASASAGFTAASAVGSAPVSGDNYLKKNGNWVMTWTDSGNPGASFFSGYAKFKGYTQGPGYWGKTLFIWPPQPATDWRKLYFQLPSGAALNDNTAIWDSTGNWKDPPGNYKINYAAILNWIKNTGPNPFPATLRAGHICFYDAIPADVPASAYDHTQSNSAIADPNQRFWKEYIDYVVGVWRDPFGNVQNPGKPACSYGPDFVAGSATPIQIKGPDYVYKKKYAAFIDPLDNPQRPQHRLWFGPMTMIQYLSDTGLLPGTANDISMVAAKLGINGALQDIQNNHPNDMVSLIMFSRPNFAGEPSGVGQFSVPRITLGRDYTGMINALWYPPNSGAADVRLWDSNDQLTPRAHGDYCGNTTTDYGLMLAYNQFSGATALQAPGMGGWGRKGAQKIVILETDGMANTGTTAGVTNAGAYKSYYNVGPLGSYSPNGNASQSALDVATRICALNTDVSGLPGFADPRRPVLIHCVAFGAIFEPTASGSEQADAVTFLQQLSTIGGTVFPSSAADPNNGYKWCIGTSAQREAKLRQAFSKVMDDTVSIVLVK